MNNCSQIAFQNEMTYACQKTMNGNNQLNFLVFFVQYRSF